MQSGDNVLSLGPPGVGKSHLAVALGMKPASIACAPCSSSATALIATSARPWPKVAWTNG